jgi:hypothetical protein
MRHFALILGGALLPLSLLGQTDSLVIQAQPVMQATPVREEVTEESLLEYRVREAVPGPSTFQPLRQVPAPERREATPLPTPATSRETQKPENL